MITVGIIDNGVDETTFSHAPNMIRQLFVGGKSTDNHGSKCAAIVSKYAHNIRLIDVQIMVGPVGNINHLCKAIEWCISNEIKVLNISCGTHLNYMYFKLKKTINKAIAQGVIIIASGSNDKFSSYPAELEGVIGVKTAPWLYENDYYTINDNCFSKGINIVASSMHYIERKDGSSYQTELCSSFASPYITALICRYLYEYNSINSNQSIHQYLSERLISEQRE